MLYNLWLMIADYWGYLNMLDGQQSLLELLSEPVFVLQSPTHILLCCTLLLLALKQFSPEDHWVLQSKPLLCQAETQHHVMIWKHSGCGLWSGSTVLLLSLWRVKECSRYFEENKRGGWDEMKWNFHDRPEETELLHHQKTKGIQQKTNKRKNRTEQKIFKNKDLMRI